MSSYHDRQTNSRVDPDIPTHDGFNLKTRPPEASMKIGQRKLRGVFLVVVLSVLSVAVRSKQLFERMLALLETYDRGDAIEQRYEEKLPDPYDRGDAIEQSYEEKLQDPNHTNRFKKFSNMESFPTPKFHGCTEGKFCEFENVCYAQRKGMLIFDVPEHPANPNDPSSQWHSLFHDERTVEARAPRIVAYDEYSKFTNVYFAEGEMLAIDCYLRDDFSTNPAHMLMGHGTLFAAAAGFYSDQRSPNTTFDTVLYHHCSLTTDVWPWGKLVDDLIWDYAIQAGAVSVKKDSMDDARLFLPINWQKPDSIDPDDLVICGKSVRQEPYAVAMYFANYMGNNDPKIVATKWREWTVKKLKLDSRFNKKQRSNDAGASCIDNLRIARWERSEGTALRKFANVEDIDKLVGIYTNRPVEVMSSTASTPPDKQIAQFRSFDLLITSHGSHAANMIFGNPEAVFIEVNTIYADNGPQINGWLFAKDYLMSFGHLPHNRSDLLERIGDCQEIELGMNPNSTCPLELRRQFRDADIVVNVTILQSDLEKAFSLLCPPISQTTLT